MTTIQDMVSANKQVSFIRYQDGALWYITDDGFEFPVPVADIGNATLWTRDNALLFVRHMINHLQRIEQARPVVETARPAPNKVRIQHGHPTHS